jgi:hypothetical protein
MTSRVELHNRGELRSSDEENVTLFEDGRVKIVANPRGGSGYLYLAAWLKPDNERSSGDGQGDTTGRGRAGASTERSAAGERMRTSVGARYATADRRPSTSGP